MAFPFRIRIDALANSDRPGKSDGSPRRASYPSTRDPQITSAGPASVTGSSHALPPDSELLASIRTGDHTTFELVYRQYYVPLWEFAYRYARTRDGAEDLVHDVFRSLWERRQSIVLHSGLRQYLFGAVRNLGIKQQEHERIVRNASASADRTVGM